MRELLILCFNANLGFFERAGLAKARARGARVTLVSDADMVHADHEATRFAGRSYLEARALCRGGGHFHPKLVVALGQDQAAVLVGSGNTSPGGWIGNAELWTLVRATEDAAPRTISGIADFLEALPPLVRFTAGVAEILGEVAAGLRSFTPTEEGPTVVTSAWGPIIRQLSPPPSPTGELLISAPFFDRNGAAVGELTTLFAPERLEVVVQDDANFDGAQLAPVIAGAGGTVATITSPRYHHGKLVEWESPEGRFALTGSPNASRPALLKSMADGGNCELALVAGVGESLRPATGEVLPPEAIAAHVWIPSRTSITTAPVHLLDVILEARGVRLDLRAPLAEPAEIQHFDGTRWVTFATVPAGEIAPVIRIPLPGASSVRLLLTDGTPSASRSVTDLERTNFRHVPAKRSIPGSGAGLVMDPRFVTIVEQALAAVRVWSGEVRGLTTRATTAAYGVKPPTEGWREYIDAFRTEVGDDFGFFVLPHIMGSVGVEAPEAASGLDDNAEAGDDTAVDEEDLEAAEVTMQLATLTDSDKQKKRIQRYRRMTEKLIGRGRTNPDAVRIAASVLTASGVALSCWPSGPDVAHRLRSSLQPLPSVHDEFRRDAASIAAVGLALIRAQVRHLSDGSPEALTYRSAAKELAPLLPYAERDDVAFRCAGLVAEGLAQLSDVDRVMGLVSAIVDPDPIAEATRELVNEHGIAAEVDGKTIKILHQVRDATATALRTLAIAQNGSPVGVRVTDTKSSVVAVWADPELIVCRWAKGRRFITRYPLGRIRPSGFVYQRGQGETSPAGTEHWGGEPPVEVTDAFALVGITLG